MGAGRNKTTLTDANGLRNTAAVCARVYVYVSKLHLRRNSEKESEREVVESERERQAVANGFPIGPSLTATHNKKWGATGERLLRNLRPHLLTELSEQFCLLTVQRNGSGP